MYHLIMFKKFSILILLSAAVACSTASLSYEDYAKKNQDNKKDFIINKNYQQVFSDLTDILEKCEQRSIQNNDYTIESSVNAEKNMGEISLKSTNFAASYRISWIRIYKKDNAARVVIFSAGSYWTERMEKYAKGENKGKCLSQFTL